MIQLDLTCNILDDIPNNGMIRLSAIVEGCLITKFPNTVQNRLNKVITIARFLEAQGGKRKQKRNLEQRTQEGSKAQRAKG